jgi:hypothetical protein
MNTDDIQFVPPTVTGDAGQEPALTGSDRHDPTHAPTRSEAHTLTTREVMKMFEDSGVPRNQRTIERYCKGGDLDCFPDALEKRYYITQTSVETLIGQLKEIASRHEKISVNAEVPPRPTPSDTARPAATAERADADVKHEATEKQEDTHRGDEAKRLAALETRIKELENEKFNLEIDKRAKEQVLGMMREQISEDRKMFTTELIKHSRRVGQLETQMLQLKAPDSRVRPTPDDRDSLDVGDAYKAEFRVAQESSTTGVDEGQK